MNIPTRSAMISAAMLLTAVALAPPGARAQTSEQMEYERQQREYWQQQEQQRQEQQRLQQLMDDNARRQQEEARQLNAPTGQSATSDYPVAAPQYESPTYSAPSAGGGGAPAVDWWSKPPLPAAKNPLLGRWRQVASREVSSEDMSAPFAGFLPPGAAEAAAALLNGATAGGCDSMFGHGVIAFNPSSLDWVAPDGHQEILNHVDYRKDGASVVVLSRDPGAISALIVGLPDNDTAVVAPFNCTLVRVTPASTPNATAHRAPAIDLGPLGAPPAGPPNATLSVLSGAATPGQGMLAPFQSVVVYLTTENPDIALAKAGFSGPNPVDAWLAACRQGQKNCKEGMHAMVASAVGTLRVDASGQAKTPALPSGQYFIVGLAPYQGKTLVWHLPYFMRPGNNTLMLNQTNGTFG